MGKFGSGVTETYKRGEAPLSCSEAGVNMSIRMIPLSRFNYVI